MSSILNMNYIPVLTEPGKVTWQDVEKRKSEIKNAAVFQNFKKAGYTVKAFSVFDVGDIKMTGGNTFMKGHEYILTEKILHNRIFKIFGWSFPEAIKRMPFMHEFDPDDLVNYNEKVTRSVLKSVAEKSRVTQFVYAHFLLPHHPYLFDSTGSPVTFNATTMNRKETYLSYLKYANNKITDLLSKLIKADPGAIIIVMSDHGYRDLVYTLGPKPFYFDNICAVRNISIPASSTISISNVNFFRYFFNTYFGQQFSYLPDSTIALSDKYHKTGDY